MALQQGLALKRAHMGKRRTHASIGDLEEGIVQRLDRLTPADRLLYPQIAERAIRSMRTAEQELKVHFLCQDELQKLANASAYLSSPPLDSLLRSLA